MSGSRRQQSKERLAPKVDQVRPRDSRASIPTDKLRQKSKDMDSRRLSDKQRRSGNGISSSSSSCTSRQISYYNQSEVGLAATYRVANKDRIYENVPQRPQRTSSPSNLSSKLRISRSISTQQAMAYQQNDGHKKLENIPRKPSLQQIPIGRKQSSDLASPRTGAAKVNRSEVRTHGGYVMHRAEGMFDLSNIHLNPADRGSVYNLLEEFKKQVDFSQVDYSKESGERENERVEYVERMSCNSSSNEQSYRLSAGTRSSHAVDSSYTRSAMEKQTHSYGSLSRSKDCSKVTTDSEEELLAQILLSMSRSSSDHPDEDESDYVNLWDSESGSSAAFQANKQVMGSLMRKKVNRPISHDSERRKAWMSTSQQSDAACSGKPTDSLYQFDMDKFKSLQEKAENMDLTLTDFFGDLKHSGSILELSKIFSSTQKLVANDCKYKCHPRCEDSLYDACTGPKTADNRHSDQWPNTKLHHDADDADSGYSGSGGSAGFTLTKEEICNKIHEYNKSVGLSSGAMTLPSDENDSFQGHIKVCICITRSINMTLSSRPKSIYEALHREDELSPQTSPTNTVVTHEKLPHNAIVSLHTSSSDTAIEVVGKLLNKFYITDNPKSFALFEQTIQHEKEVTLRKVADQERPLINYLRWITECNSSKRFVLKENNSGDIMYEAFSIPELNNFLRVLEQEEGDKLTEIQKKYQTRRKQLADRLRELETERSRPSLKTTR